MILETNPSVDDVRQKTIDIRNINVEMIQKTNQASTSNTDSSASSTSTDDTAKEPDTTVEPEK